MPLRSDTPGFGSIKGGGASEEPASVPADPMAVGDRVRSGHSDNTGTVVAVDDETLTMQVVWDDGEGRVITYPSDAYYLEKVFKWPWEKT